MEHAIWEGNLEKARFLVENYPHQMTPEVVKSSIRGAEAFYRGDDLQQKINVVIDYLKSVSSGPMGSRNGDCQ